MEDEAIREIYKDVPPDLVEEVLRFRETHQPKSIVFQGHEWQYLDCGSGEQVLVLLPGGTRRPSLGPGLITDLEDDFRIIAPYYPNTSSFGSLANGVHAILEHEGIKKVQVFGSSFGGLVAQVFVKMHPEYVTHLVIGNTATSVENPEYEAQMDATVSTIKETPEEVVLEQVRNMLIGLTTGTSPEDALWTAMLNEIFARGWITKQEVVHHYEGLIDFQKNHRVSPETLEKWGGNMLIIRSDDDPAVDKIGSEALSTVYPKARIHTFHGAGHSPYTTNRDEYLSLIREALEVK